MKKGQITFLFAKSKAKDTLNFAKILSLKILIYPGRPIDRRIWFQSVFPETSVLFL